MRSRSPATSARACWASCAYCSGLLPLRLSVVNMSCSLAAAAAAPGLCGGKGGAMNATGEAQAPRMADGFVHRGRQVTRLETFVDAAFAFAVTLLVISIDEIPDSRAALVLALKAVPSFAACFAMIAMFWAAHARWSRRYGFDDAASTTLSLLLVFVVLVYVYPLRLQFGVFFAWVTGGWLPSPMRIKSAADVGFMFLVYGLAFAMMSLCMLGLYAHAWRRRDAVGLDAGERARTAGELARSEEHTSELQSLMRISYAVFCLKTKKTDKNTIT